MDNRKLVITGVMGAAVTGFCLDCGATTSASVSAALGVPISSDLLASEGLPIWLGWANDMLRGVTVFFLSLAGYGIYRERKKAIPMGNMEPAAGGSRARFAEQTTPIGERPALRRDGSHASRDT